MEAKTSALQRQNQQLKMQLTELRNAFDLNRDVLNILSLKSEPSTRHFYMMLKKLNEHIIDLADNQFKARRDRYKKVEEYHELELKFTNAEEQIKALRLTHDQFSKQQADLHSNPTYQDKFVITPKESHLILMEEIRNISNELFTMSNSFVRLKSQNNSLILENERLRQYRTGINQQPRLEPKRKRFQETVQEVFSQDESDEVTGELDANRTLVIRRLATTSRNKKTLPKKTNPYGEQEIKKIKLFQTQLDQKTREIQQLKRSLNEAQNKLRIILGVHNRIASDIHLKPNKAQKKLKLQSSSISSEKAKLIELVQWRFQMQVLEEPQILHCIRPDPTLRNHSI